MINHLTRFLHSLLLRTLKVLLLLKHFHIWFLLLIQWTRYGLNMILIENNVWTSFFLFRITWKLVLFLSIQLHSWSKFIHGLDSLLFLSALSVCGSVEFFNFKNELISKFTSDWFVEDLFLVLDFKFMLGFTIDSVWSLEFFLGDLMVI